MISPTHLLYAEDTLNFGEQEVRQLRYLRLIFNVLRLFAGHHVSWAKSRLNAVNSVVQLHNLAAILCRHTESLPTVYLGLPLGAKHKADSIWQDVIEKYEKRLSNWKKQYFSLGGRLILVTSVLDAMPAYVTSLFSNAY